MTIRSPLRTLLLPGVFVIGILSGYTIHSFLYPEKVVSSAYPIREHDTEYKFIKPLLAVGNVDISSKYENLAEVISNYISTESSADAYASVYFNNLGSGGRFVVNEEKTYAPASLLKVVILIGYLKEADTNPEILNQEFIYTPTIQKNLEDTPFQTPTTLVIGKSYSVEDLLTQMIADSDNGAKDLLYSHISDSYLTEIYTDLGLESPEIGSPYTISVKSYSLFFRILYNATYLSKPMSEKALSILAKAKFDDGLTAVLPDTVTVAHKFGEHVGGTEGEVTDIELHDCGIIYLPDNPYFLCVMTHGPSLNSVEQLIQGISGIIYKELKNE